MGLYLYCLGGPGHPAPDDAPGLGGAVVESLALAGFSAWISRLDAAPPPSLEGARAHNEVVERACATETALPVRFGQWFPDRAALEALLRDRERTLSSALRRVAGSLEMGVRILDPHRPDDPPDRSTGRAYLEALARRESGAKAARERGAAIAAELREWLGPLVVDSRARPLGTAAGLVTISLLVARHDTGDYNARVREFPDRYPDLRFLFSGPWPPYGFADDDRKEAG